MGAQEHDRKALIRIFLKKHSYNDVGTPKQTMLKAKYPIHTAAKMGDPKVVAALLKEGANPAQKDSAGQTAAQVAQQKNKNGSHADVLKALSGAQVAQQKNKNGSLADVLKALSGAQVAKQKNKNSSHADVLKALSGAQVAQQNNKKGSHANVRNAFGGA